MTEQILVVDGANVVGSRPDGWWRDRAGAAARLHDRLLRADDLSVSRVILVLEGKARAGVPAGRESGVQTVHAGADGDSTIVDLVAELGSGADLRVVTADRALASAVRDLGAHVVGPGWLMERLDPS